MNAVDEADIDKWLRLYANACRTFKRPSRARILEAAANEIDRLRNCLAEAGYR